jgi:hypothetical protein
MNSGDRKSTSNTEESVLAKVIGSEEGKKNRSKADTSKNVSHTSGDSGTKEHEVIEPSKLVEVNRRSVAFAQPEETPTGPLTPNKAKRRSSTNLANRLSLIPLLSTNQQVEQTRRIEIESDQVIETTNILKGAKKSITPIKNRKSVIQPNKYVDEEDSDHEIAKKVDKSVGADKTKKETKKFVISLKKLKDQHPASDCESSDSDIVPDKPIKSSNLSEKIRLHKQLSSTLKLDGSLVVSNQKLGETPGREAFNNSLRRKSKSLSQLAEEEDEGQFELNEKDEVIACYPPPPAAGAINQSGVYVAIENVAPSSTSLSTKSVGVYNEEQENTSKISTRSSNRQTSFNDTRQMSIRLERIDEKETEAVKKTKIKSSITITKLPKPMAPKAPPAPDLKSPVKETTFVEPEPISMSQPSSDVMKKSTSASSLFSSLAQSKKITSYASLKNFEEQNDSKDERELLASNSNLLRISMTKSTNSTKINSSTANNSTCSQSSQKPKKDLKGSQDLPPSTPIIPAAPLFNSSGNFKYALSLILNEIKLNFLPVLLTGFKKFKCFKIIFLRVHILGSKLRIRF